MRFFTFVAVVLGTLTVGNAPSVDTQKDIQVGIANLTRILALLPIAWCLAIQFGRDTGLNANLLLFILFLMKARMLALTRTMNLDKRQLDALTGVLSGVAALVGKIIGALSPPSTNPQAAASLSPIVEALLSVFSLLSKLLDLPPVQSVANSVLNTGASKAVMQAPNLGTLLAGGSIPTLGTGLIGGVANAASPPADSADFK
ncbi:hypothetical protein C8R45DRAFT_942004 [Mycena sanguinolenta]|nr:hypothetical protein C8R45DRAFT_942004 [Mycena sanguinolenta]